jgi:prepilin-type N-terminal cleavage/methylation domain-containing protein
MNAAPVHPAPRPQIGRNALTLVELLVVFAIIGVMAAIIFPGYSGPSRNVQRAVEGTNLRTIGQAMLAAENDQPGTLSSVNPPDIYAFAAQLAHSGLNDWKLWLSKVDAANPYPSDSHSFIIAVNSAADGTRPINPKFQGLPLAFAVALFPPGTDITKLPPTTPLAWTRGLQPDGKWAKTSAPYGDWGGFIVFAGGNLEKYVPKIGGKLVKFGTTQPTSDIREALPPGTRISEFTPKPKSP